jgi:hypothetical protein
LDARTEADDKHLKHTKELKIMTTIQLLTEELLPSECSLLQETSQDGKNIWLSGIFMQADLKNRNGRVYPMNEIASAVETAKQKIKEQNGIMGELDHPQSLQINLDRVSHVITELWMNGANAYGKARLLNTPMGNIAQELVKNGVKLGVSSRGAGNVNESGGVSQFQFITVDIVAQPSAPNAYPTSVYESLQLSKSGHNIQSLAEAAQHDKKAQVFLKKEILNWLNSAIFSKK